MFEEQQAASQRMMENSPLHNLGDIVFTFAMGRASFSRSPRNDSPSSPSPVGRKATPGGGANNNRDNNQE